MNTYILDTSSFMHRAYHASKDRPWHDKDGSPIAAIRLFRQMLERLRRDQNPDYIVAACDTGKPSFRVGLYPEYKADRVTPPEDFLAQKPGMYAVLDALSIPMFELAGFEADDVIGTLVQQIPADVYIATCDKDMMQLVRRGVYVANPDKGTIDSAAVLRIMCVQPGQVVDLLALEGDATDNVPGAPGIGRKGSRELLAQFGSVERIIAESGRIYNAGYRRAVQKYGDQILLSKQLVTIRTDLVLPPGLIV
jgi:DNA polymerase I